MTTTTGRVLVIAAHPDNPDFLAGGTVARLAKEGREVAYVILTNSNKGSGNRSVTSEQLASIREEEQRRAAHVLSGTLSSSATRMVSWKIRASSGATLPAKSDGGGRTSSYGWARK